MYNQKLLKGLLLSDLCNIYLPVLNDLFMDYMATPCFQTNNVFDLTVNVLVNLNNLPQIASFLALKNDI
jgi:hypothetical protein